MAGPPLLALAENPDILRTLSMAGTRRPSLVIGFAAETERVAEHARAKLAAKGCDWIVANDVSPASGTFNGTHNTVSLLRAASNAVEEWPRLDKHEVAARLAEAIVAHFSAI